MADYFSRDPELDKGEDELGRYLITKIDNKIIMEKLNKLANMEPKVMIHRILRKDYKAIRLASKYKYRCLTIIKKEEILK